MPCLNPARWLLNRLINWLNAELPTVENLPSDFAALCRQVKPADVVIVSGRSRIGGIIKTVTQSQWTHSALYIGRLCDIKDPELHQALRAHTDAADDEPLIVESLLGYGTVVNRLSDYAESHLRICRAQHLSPDDAQQVIAYSISKLGTEYDIRQLIDLARFMFPYALMPRRWRSSLFNYHPGTATRLICSTMIAEAFMQIHYPVLPITKTDTTGQVKLYQRNPRLFSPKDFDLSPYFDVLKFPLYGHHAHSYRQMQWESPEILCDDVNHCYPVALASCPVPTRRTKNMAGLK